MNYKDFSKETRQQIDRIAKKSGVNREEVVARFERLFHGHGVSKHSRRVFS